MLVCHPKLFAPIRLKLGHFSARNFPRDCQETDQFFTIANLFNLLNTSSVN